MVHAYACLYFNDEFAGDSHPQFKCIFAGFIDLLFNAKPFFTNELKLQWEI